MTTPGTDARNGATPLYYGHVDRCHAGEVFRPLFLAPSESCHGLRLRRRGLRVLRLLLGGGLGLGVGARVLRFRLGGHLPGYEDQGDDADEQADDDGGQRVLGDLVADRHVRDRTGRVRDRRVAGEVGSAPEEPSETASHGDDEVAPQRDPSGDASGPLDDGESTVQVGRGLTVVVDVRPERLGPVEQRGEPRLGGLTPLVDGFGPLDGETVEVALPVELGVGEVETAVGARHPGHGVGAELIDSGHPGLRGVGGRGLMASTLSTATAGRTLGRGLGRRHGEHLPFFCR